MPLFCPSCEASNRRGTWYCTACGAMLTEDPPEGAPRGFGKSECLPTKTERGSIPPAALLIVLLLVGAVLASALLL